MESFVTSFTTARDLTLLAAAGNNTNEYYIQGKKMN
jgi:hypothetical protein